MSASLDKIFRYWNPKILIILFIVAAFLIILQASGYSPISSNTALIITLSVLGVYLAMKHYHIALLRELRRSQGISKENIEDEVEELYPPPKP